MRAEPDVSCQLSEGWRRLCFLEAAASHLDHLGFPLSAGRQVGAASLTGAKTGALGFLPVPVERDVVL
jgi:hypothetical protein